jgi:hypothetical protein
MSQTQSEISEATPDLFHPSKWRALFAFVVAGFAFFIPQEIPLEYYPLNNPGTDINYLEITCAADKTGGVEVFLDFGRGFNELEKISWPIGPSEMAFTYTFPLQDAPLIDLRLDSPIQGVKLFIRQMRIINRRNEEIQRFTRDLFQPISQILSLDPEPDGWTIASPADSIDPITRVKLGAPIVPVGMNHRNLLRCLLSAGYLSMMLWIILLAVYFAFYVPAGWRSLLQQVSFLAFLAVIFSIVGNRGLIRNSIRYASYVAPANRPGLHMEFDLRTTNPSAGQLYWDVGDGVSEATSARQNHEPHSNLQTLRLALPDRPLKALRFDPQDGDGKVEIRAIRLANSANHTLAVLPLDSLERLQNVDEPSVNDDWLTLNIPSGANDPVLMFDSQTLDLINRLQSEAPSNR